MFGDQGSDTLNVDLNLTPLMDVMSNIMLNQHVTTMNIIENIGGTGNYWEVTDYNCLAGLSAKVRRGTRALKRLYGRA